VSAAGLEPATNGLKALSTKKFLSRTLNFETFLSYIVYRLSILSIKSLLSVPKLPGKILGKTILLVGKETKTFLVTILLGRYPFTILLEISIF